MSSDGAATSTSTAPAPATTTIPASSTSTAPTTTSTTAISRATTTTQAASPEDFAKALYGAWMAGDRAAAQRVAQPEAITTLFSRPWQASDGWSFSECTGAAGSVICTWQRPAGQQVLFRVQNRTGGGPVTVAEVRFQP